ncbi:hypothetical protein ColTof4_11452 [Colletotrichum tofieldiae]|nr:hypothetical protein ColTof3_04639 [Colletotrichum tofieldiae]GKT79029.1 hypothetical protein ColTof4_11452 [Colletotrichum tofieldiae]
MAGCPAQTAWRLACFLIQRKNCSTNSVTTGAAWGREIWQKSQELNLYGISTPSPMGPREKKRHPATPGRPDAGNWVLFGHSQSPSWEMS